MFDLGFNEVCGLNRHAGALAGTEGIEDHGYAGHVVALQVIQHQPRAIDLGEVAHERLEFIGALSAIQRQVYVFELPGLVQGGQKLPHILERHRR